MNIWKFIYLNTYTSLTPHSCEKSFVLKHQYEAKDGQSIVFFCFVFFNLGTIYAKGLSYCLNRTRKRQYRMKEHTISSDVDVVVSSYFHCILHVFVLGHHPGLINCGGLGRRKIYRWSRRKVDKWARRGEGKENFVISVGPPTPSPPSKLCTNPLLIKLPIII